MAKIRFVLDNFSDLGEIKGYISDSMVLTNVDVGAVSATAEGSPTTVDIGPDESTFDVSDSHWSYTATTLDYVGTSSIPVYTFADDADIAHGVTYEVKYTISAASGAFTAQVILGKDSGTLLDGASTEQLSAGFWTEDIIANFEGISALANKVQVVASGTGSFSIKIDWIKRKGTGFQFTQLVPGDGSNAESTRIDFGGDGNDGLDGKYWTFDTLSTNYYVWYNVSGSAGDPAAGGTGVQVNLSNGASACDVGDATRTAIESLTTVTNDEVGFESTLPVTNLQKISKSQLARTSTNTNTQIRGKFNGAKNISAFILGRHNLPINTRYRFRLYNNSTFTEPTLYDSLDTQEYKITDIQKGSKLIAWGDFIWGDVIWAADEAVTSEFAPPANLEFWFNPAENGALSYKLDLYKGWFEPAIVTQFEIGRLFIGDYIEPTYNFSYGHGMQWQENTKQYRTESGTLRSDTAVPYREFSFELKTITESDRVLLQHQFRDVGLRKDFYMSMFSTDTHLEKQKDYSAIVKITKVPKFTEFITEYYNSKYTMEEI
jgi:hypothetical protein